MKTISRRGIVQHVQIVESSAHALAKRLGRALSVPPEERGHDIEQFVCDLKTQTELERTFQLPRDGEAFDTLSPASLLRSLIAAVGMAAESPMGLQASDGCLFALKHYLAPFYELKPTVPMGQGGEGAWYSTYLFPRGLPFVPEADHKGLVPWEQPTSALGVARAALSSYLLWGSDREFSGSYHVAKRVIQELQDEETAAAVQAEMDAAECPAMATRDCLFLAHLVSIKSLKAVANPGTPGGLDRLPQLAALFVRHSGQLVHLRPDLPLALHEAAHAHVILGDFSRAQELAVSGVQMADRVGDRFYGCIARKCLASILCLGGDSSRGDLVPVERVRQLRSEWQELDSRARVWMPRSMVMADLGSAELVDSFLTSLPADCADTALVPPISCCQGPVSGLKNSPRASTSLMRLRPR